MKKKHLKRVAEAWRQLNEVRLERIRELIRQRNDFQQETITLKQQLAEAQSNGDDRLTRWRQRWTALRDEDRKLRQENQDLRVLLAERDRELVKSRKNDPGRQPGYLGFCNEQMIDEHSGREDPHWCDKTPDHEKIISDGGSPHRCGDCKQEWVELK